jgi:hypothetical protein
LLIVFTLGACSFVEFFDKDSLEKAKVVLRVECERGALTCEKYCWQTVKILEVLKDESNNRFRKNTQVEIAYYNWDNGIPPGTSTIYLEEYHAGRDDLWKLLGGSSNEGVSHYKSSRLGAAIEDGGRIRREITVINGKRVR